MWLFCEIRFFTLSRKLADSSPNTTRPSQSMTITPSTVRVLSLSCTENPPCPAPGRLQGNPVGVIPQAHKSHIEAAPNGRLPGSPPSITYNQVSSPMSYQVLARKYRPQKFSEVMW